MLNAPEQVIRNFISTQYDPGNSRDIQVLCSYSDLKKVFSRIKEQWVAIGKVEPYASVLSDEKYTRNNIENNLYEFHETGLDALKHLRALCRKNDVDCPNGVLFELGCGVGRSTQYFAPEFEMVHAWDVSDGNLAECKNNLKSANVSNVETKLIDQLEGFAQVPWHDVFFSEIVIQHNPPPLQYFILDKILSKLRPGGVFYFQTITHHATYSFSVEPYLRWEHQQSFEMHALPMRWVNKVIRRNGLFLMDVLKERLGGYNLDSYTFFGVREN
jgi:cyclopropane fatty-acyl-phospholipid synthase-like methyltransferase